MDRTSWSTKSDWRKDNIEEEKAMCEFSDMNHMSSAMNFFRGRAPQEVFPEQLRRRFPYAFQKGRCPKCGTYLSIKERIPRGRATRSMCHEDYNQLIAYRMDQDCFLCGNSLPHDKFKAQKQNPREVKHHLHDRACFHCWTLIHNVAVAELDVVDGGIKPVYTVQKALPPPKRKLKISSFLSYKGKPVKVLK